MSALGHRRGLNYYERNVTGPSPQNKRLDLTTINCTGEAHEHKTLNLYYDSVFNHLNFLSDW